MPRLTVEECRKKVPNHFDLVLLAARRSRDISAGAPITVDRERDKNPVVALREIAKGTVYVDAVGERLVNSLRTIRRVEETEAESPDVQEAISELMSGDGEFSYLQQSSLADVGASDRMEISLEP